MRRKEKKGLREKSQTKKRVRKASSDTYSLVSQAEKRVGKRKKNSGKKKEPGGGKIKRGKKCGRKRKHLLHFPKVEPRSIRGEHYDKLPREGRASKTRDGQKFRSHAAPYLKTGKRGVGRGRINENGRGTGAIQTNAPH